MKNFILNTLLVCVLASLFLVMVEAMSANPYYTLEKATVKRVVDDPPWTGFIGTDKRTLIRFHDGLNTEVGGDLGVPGEEVLAPRHRGVITAFGILGNESYYFPR